MPSSTDRPTRYWADVDVPIRAEGDVTAATQKQNRCVYLQIDVDRIILALEAENRCAKDAATNLDKVVRRLKAENERLRAENATLKYRRGSDE